jgi:TolA-binding protein
MSVRLASAAVTAALLLSGCTAMDVVTLPVKVAKTGVDAAGAAVDAVTTSQSEADQKRGREIRKREERLGKLQREFDKLQGRCLKGDRRACEKQATVRARMDAMIPTVPYEAN